jgi:anti-anti-sigma factor
MKLTITTDVAHRSATVHVSGDLDFSTTGALLGAVTELLTPAGALRGLHLNFSGLEYCTSSGLAGLIDIHRQAAESGTHLNLDHRPAQLNRMMVLTGTLEMLTGEVARTETTELG